MSLRVTDHALVRFLARAGGLDIEAMRANLAASLTRAARAADQLHQGECRVIADGLEYVVSDGKVITIIDPRENRR